MLLPTTEKIHTTLFVGIGLGALLSYGLGTGSYSTLKWVFLYLGVALVLVGSAVRIIRTKKVEIDRFALAWLSVNAFAALSLIWSPDPDGGLVQVTGLAAITVLVLYVRHCDRYALTFRLSLLSVCVVGVLLLRGVIVPGIHGGFGNENYFSETILLCLPFALCWYWIRDRLDRWFGPILVVAGIIFLLFFSGSRIGIVALVTLLGCSALLGILRRYGVWQFAGCIVIAAVAVGYIGMSFHEVILEFDPVQARIELYINSVALWLERPFLGTGLGGYSFHYPEFQQFHLLLYPGLGITLTSPFNIAYQAHNEFLQILVEAGVVGLLIVAFIIFQIGQNLGVNFDRSKLHWLAGVAAVFLAVIAMLSFPLRNPATAAQAAIILGILARGKGTKISQRLMTIRLPHLITYLPTVMATLVAGLIILVCGNMLLASRDFRISAFYGERFPGRAFFHVKRAYDRFPQSVLYRSQLFANYVNWAVKKQDRNKVPDSIHTKFFKVGLSTGANNPGLLLTQLRFLMDSKLDSSKRAEIESLLVSLKKYTPYFYRVHHAGGVYAKAIGDISRSKAAFARARKVKARQRNGFRKKDK
jgi:O-antigen ligase